MLLVEKEKTPWENGRLDAFAGRPKLLFGRMHEDWTVEASLFPKGATVFCIASAGCTAMALAALGHSVTAVDLNPVQIDYVRRRLKGGPFRRGSVDWFLAWGRRALPWLGLSRRDLLAFLNLENLEEQIGFWRSRLDNAVWRKALDFALGQTLLQSVYSRFLVQTLPQGFAEVIRRRLERGWQTHPNRSNPYAWRMLLGCEAPGEAPLRAPDYPVNLVCADAADYLNARPPASFHGFALSNILDGASGSYRKRLFEAIYRTAAPGAVLVLRSFLEPNNEDEEVWAARDRAMLWGRVVVERVHVPHFGERLRVPFSSRVNERSSCSTG